MPASLIAHIILVDCESELVEACGSDLDFSGANRSLETF